MTIKGMEEGVRVLATGLGIQLILTLNLSTDQVNEIPKLLDHFFPDVNYKERDKIFCISRIIITFEIDLSYEVKEEEEVKETDTESNKLEGGTDEKSHQEGVNLGLDQWDLIRLAIIAALELDPTSYKANLYSNLKLITDTSDLTKLSFPDYDTVSRLLTPLLTPPEQPSDDIQKLEIYLTKIASFIELINSLFNSKVRITRITLDK